MTEQQQQTNKCQICDMQYNKSTARPITCPHCEKTVCRACWQQFFLTDEPSVLHPRCMMPQCKTTLSTNFVRKHFSKTFLTGALRERQINIASKINDIYIPETQRIIALEDYIEQNTKKIKEYEEQISNICALMSPIAADSHDKCNTIYNIMHGPKSAYQHTYKCPIDNCTGYLSEIIASSAAAAAAPPSTEIKYCSMCKNNVCCECNGIIANTSAADILGHVCDPEARQALNAIRANAKPCPKCGVFISKTDGCNDMFCNLCNTPFRYDTGHIQVQNSNPMYAEYISTAATATMATTAAMPTQTLELNGTYYQMIRSYMLGMKEQPSLPNFVEITINYFTEALNKTVDVLFQCQMRQQWAHPRYYARVEDLYNTPAAYQLRLKKLKGGITEADYNAELYKLFYINNIAGDFAAIFEAFIQSTRDLLTELYYFVAGLPQIEKSIECVFQWGFYTKLEAIVNRTNEAFRQVSTNYNITPRFYIGLYSVREYRARSENKSMMLSWMDYRFDVRLYTPTRAIKQHLDIIEAYKIDYAKDSPKYAKMVEYIAKCNEPPLNDLVPRCFASN